FLDPILRFRNRMRKKFPHVYFYNIHGMKNDARVITNDPNLGFIIGCGEGTPPSYTCSQRTKNLFTHTMENHYGWHVYEAGSGGSYAGWSRNNLNQLFRKHYTDHSVQSIQIEIVAAMRETNSQAEITGEMLADVAHEVFDKTDWKEPPYFKIRVY